MASPLTEAYRRSQLGLRQRTLEAVTLAWAAIVTFDDLASSHMSWTLLATEYVVVAQQLAVDNAAGYLNAFAAERSDGRVRPVTRPPDVYVGVGEHGDPVDRRLAGSAVAVRYALMMRLPDPLRSGLVRAQQVTAMDVAHAGRAALDDTIRDTPEFVGWTRVGGGGCARCRALSGKTYSVGEPFYRHPYCRCTAEPRFAARR